MDSSGIRFYYTKELREHQTGLLRLGDPLVALAGQPVGDGLSQHTFDCSGSCSKIMFNDEEVTVLREYLHMHYAGSTMQNHLIRDGEIIHTGSVDYFRFNQQGNQVVQQSPYKVKRGDAFRTVCNYDNRGKNANYGFSSQEEMCITFIMYYPKQAKLAGTLSWTCAYEMGLSQCEPKYTNVSIPELPRTFGRALDECPVEPVPEPDSGASTKYSIVTGFVLILASCLL